MFSTVVGGYRSHDVNQELSLAGSVGRLLFSSWILEASLESPKYVPQNEAH